jgi:hypothetical protein
MDATAMEPFGEALKAYCTGDSAAEVVICRDDGVESPLPISHFFREPAAFTTIEQKALNCCRGRILDAGAGTGLHSLELQRRGNSVTALDICPHAVGIMLHRGVKDAVCSNIFAMISRTFDTLLLLGHGIGMMETLAGLDRFLLHARTLVSERGQILLDSMDPAITLDSRNRSYQAANRAGGRYIGEVRMYFVFHGVAGPYCGWLHVDPRTLCEHAAAAGWSCSILLQEASGEYLAQLTTKEH